MEIRFGKILVYILTFVCYIYSGYGSGILSNLRDAVLVAETTFGDIFSNVIRVARHFKNIHDVFDQAVEEDCVFTCPNDFLPKSNKNHIPSANGCGTLGVSIPNEYLPITEMTKCCDAHDICYDTCGKDKEICDVDFRRCLYKYCDTYDGTIGGVTTVKGCKGAAKMLFTGTMTLGCKAFKDAQTIACYCPPSYEKRKDKKNRYKEL